jgi:hypothetical protein
MRDGMLQDAVGRQLLEERPRIVQSTVARCWDLPPSTFGGAYAEFMVSAMNSQLGLGNIRHGLQGNIRHGLGNIQYG